MTKWEYKESPTIGTDLAALGLDGWELVAVSGPSMMFKRPIEAPAPPAAAPPPAPAAAPKPPSSPPASTAQPPEAPATTA